MIKLYMDRAVLIPIGLGAFAWLLTYESDSGLLNGLVWTLIYVPVGAFIGCMGFPFPLKIAGALWQPVYMTACDLFWKLDLVAPYGFAQRLAPWAPYGMRGAYVLLCAVAAALGWACVSFPGQTREKFREFRWIDLWDHLRDS